MGEAIRNSSDIPEFSTYPSSPKDQLLSGTTVSPALHRGAERVGEVLGQGVVAAREAGERARSRVTQVKSSLTDQFESARERVSDKYTSVRDRSLQAAQDRIDQGFVLAQKKAKQAREVAEKRPVAVILAAGAIGLLLGIGVRIWRDRYAE